MTKKELQIQIALGTANASIRGDIGTWEVSSNGVITDTKPELNQVKEGTIRISIHGSDWEANVDVDDLTIGKAQEIDINKQPIWDWIAAQLPS